MVSALIISEGEPLAYNNANLAKNVLTGIFSISVCLQTKTVSVTSDNQRFRYSSCPGLSKIGLLT